MRLIDADAIPYTMLYKEDFMHGTGVEKLGVWKDVIDAMPTIEPQRTGEWMRNPDDTAGSGYFICSECKTDFYDVWKYCPNCGAKMAEPEDIPMEYFVSGGR